MTENKSNDGKKTNGNPRFDRLVRHREERKKYRESLRTILLYVKAGTFGSGRGCGRTRYRGGFDQLHP